MVQLVPLQSRPLARVRGIVTCQPAVEQRVAPLGLADEAQSALTLSCSGPDRSWKASDWVIWDLDDTFWQGTLTEGGVAYSQQCHDIVVTLARRGIMSSICSNNHRRQAATILRDKGIWNYFVFPDIG